MKLTPQQIDALRCTAAGHTIYYSSFGGWFSCFPYRATFEEKQRFKLKHIERPTTVIRALVRKGLVAIPGRPRHSPELAGDDYFTTAPLTEAGRALFGKLDQPTPEEQHVEV